MANRIKKGQLKYPNVPAEVRQKQQKHRTLKAVEKGHCEEGPITGNTYIGMMRRMTLGELSKLSELGRKLDE